MSEPTESGRPEPAGASVRQFADSFLGLLQTRIEILALEWSEERANLTRLLLSIVGVLVCLQLALVVGLLFVLLVVSKQHRVAVLGVGALLLLFAAAAIALGLRSWLARRPPMFRTTVEELRKDRESLRRRS